MNPIPSPAQNQHVSTPHLIWLYAETPAQTLDAATWLETTRELRHLGWNVTLVAQGTAGIQSIRGVKVKCIRRPRIFFLGQLLFHLRFLLFMIREWHRTDFFLVHENSAFWLLPFIPLVRLILGKRTRVLVDTRTLPMEHSTKATLKDRLRGIAHVVARRLANRVADGRLAITLRMAESVGIPQRKLWGVWPSGVNTDIFANARSAQRFPGLDEPIRLVYVGSLHYERNLMTLARAVETLNVEGEKFNLTLIGKGTEANALKSFAQQTQGRIEVIDPIPHEQIPGKLAEFHIGVLPFPDEEKFRVSSPIKLFEYMAVGMPILATRIVCHTDVTGTDAPYMFWASDGSEQALVASLIEVDCSRVSLKERGENAAAAAVSWTWRKSAEKLAQALEANLSRNVAGLVDSQGEPIVRVGVILSMKKGMEHFVYRELKEMSDQGASLHLCPSKFQPGLYNALPEWKVEQWTILSVLFMQGISFLRAPRIYWNLFKMARKYHAYADFMLAWYFSTKLRQVDTIYSIFGDHKLFIGYFVKLILHKPLVVTIHAYELYRNPNPDLFVEALAACDQVVTVTDYNRDLLTQRYAVDPAKIQVIRIGVDLDNYQFEKKFVILIVAFFTARKGHEILLRAVRQTEQKDIEVWVVGSEGNEVNSVDVRGLAREIGVEDQVAFFGALSQNALKAVYRQCDVFCLPSHHDERGLAEGFPTVLAEAMAFGKPVISTQHAEIPRVLEHVLVPEKDVDALARAIQQVYASTALQDQLGSENREKAEMLFSIRHNAGQMVDVFKQVIQPKSPKVI